MGFAQSYNETLKFESAAVTSSRISISEGAFCQYVFDNADQWMVMALFIQWVNVNVSDGLNRLNINENIGTFGQIPVKIFKRDAENFNNVTLNDIKDLQIINPEILNKLTMVNSLWLCGHVFHFQSCPSWQGFMNLKADKFKEFSQSKVLPLPFVNLDPNNLKHNLQQHFIRHTA